MYRSTRRAQSFTDLKYQAQKDLSKILGLSSVHFKNVPSLACNMPPGLKFAASVFGGASHMALGAG
eukprot:COSAG02_NODE_1601_length_11741_cov_40.329411_9_plen_66_part_00